MIQINASLKKARLRPIFICGLCYFHHQADGRSSCTAWIALEKERVNKMPFKIKEVVSEDDKEKNMLCGVANFQTEDCLNFIVDVWAELNVSQMWMNLSCTRMCDTTNSDPGELPVTGSMWGRICAWKVRFITGEKQWLKFKTFSFYLLPIFALYYKLRSRREGFSNNH